MASADRETNVSATESKDTALITGASSGIVAPTGWLGVAVT
jgi:hypothetical protein